MSERGSLVAPVFFPGGAGDTDRARLKVPESGAGFVTRFAVDAAYL